MPSIFEGVPIILNLPGQYQPVPNIGATFVAARRARDARQLGQQQLEAQRSVNESLKRARDTQTKLNMAQLRFTEDRAADQSTLLDYSEALGRDPLNTPKPSLRLFDSIGKAQALESMAVQKAKNLNDAGLVALVDKSIMELPFELQAQATEMRSTEGLSPNLFRFLRENGSKVQEDRLAAQMQTGVIPGLPGVTNARLVANTLISQADEMESLNNGPTPESIRNREEAAAILRDLKRTGSTSSRLSETQKAELDIAKTEFEQATENLEVDDPDYQEAKNKYLRAIQRIAPQSDLSNVFQKFGFSNQDISERLFQGLRIQRGDLGE